MLLVGDMVSLTSGTYLYTLFGGMSHVMTRLYVCFITPGPCTESHYKENGGDCFFVMGGSGRW